MTEQTAKKEKKKAIIEINKEWCTGCRICVEMCPVQVLEMIDCPSKVVGQISSVKNLDACTQCMMCEMHCPDFAITVE